MNSISVLANQGLQRLAGASSPSARLQVGDEVLLGISRDAGATADEKALAELARVAGGREMDPHSATAFEQSALKALAGGIQGPAGAVAARLVLDLPKSSMRDVRVVMPFLQKSPDVRTKTLADLAADIDLQKAPESFRHAVTRGILEEIARPGAAGVAATGTRVAAVDDEAVQQQALLEGLSVEKRELGVLEREAARQEQQATACQQRMKACEQERAAVEGKIAPLGKKARVLGLVSNLGMLAASGGAFATFALGMSGMPALMGLVGGAVFVMTVRAHGRAEQEHYQAIHDLQSLSMERVSSRGMADQLLRQAQAMRDEAASVRRTVSAIEGRVLIEKMSAPRKPAGSVTVDADAIAIGGLRVPRKV